MYHRFNEYKYPSTNIQMDVFKEHMQIIKKSDFKFHYPNKFEEEFNNIKILVDPYLFGSAFNDGWNLLKELDHSDQIKDITHIF